MTRLRKFGLMFTMLLMAGIMFSALPAAHAQRCAGKSYSGCAVSGAVCSPPDSGTGIQGRCTTQKSAPGEFDCVCVGDSPDLGLTGTWTADDGGIYYVRQLGNQVWWAGFSVETPLGVGDFHKGLQFTNIFQGQISGNTINGDWVDVPRGRTFNSGTLTLNFSSNLIQRQAATGGVVARVWNRTVKLPLTTPERAFADFELLSPIPVDYMYFLFNNVKKNQNAYNDHSLLDNLKPAKKKPAVVFGNIVRLFVPAETFFGTNQILVPAHFTDIDVSYLAHDGRSYNDFICLDNNNSPPDGDLDFTIQVDRSVLDKQIGFWDNAWETGDGITPENFRNKLSVKNQLHAEAIMYGGTTECGNTGAPSFYFPGWQQRGAQSVLFNGKPIAGQIAIGNTVPPQSTTHFPIELSKVNSILGTQVNAGDRVRITGILALDCGHGWTRPCDEDDPSTQNQEMHPVYAIDLVQNFHKPRPLALLTGVWSSDDGGTYYVRQTGNTIWWLGISSDEGRTFANVFRGTIQNGQVTGNWADLPLGGTFNAGSLSILSGTAQSVVWKRLAETGGFSGSSWEKLYDSGNTNVVIGAKAEQ